VVEGGAEARRRQEDVMEAQRKTVGLAIISLQKRFSA